MRVCRVCSTLQVIKPQHTPADRVFERPQASSCEMIAAWFDPCNDLVDIQASVGKIIQWLRLNTAQHGGPAPFKTVGMRFLARNVFIATLAMAHQRDQIAS